MNANISMFQQEQYILISNAIWVNFLNKKADTELPLSHAEFGSLIYHAWDIIWAFGFLRPYPKGVLSLFEDAARGLAKDTRFGGLYVLS